MNCRESRDENRERHQEERYIIRKGINKARFDKLEIKFDCNDSPPRLFYSKLSEDVTMCYVRNETKRNARVRWLQKFNPIGWKFLFRRTGNSIIAATTFELLRSDVASRIGLHLRSHRWIPVRCGTPGCCRWCPWLAIDSFHGQRN